MRRTQLPEVDLSVYAKAVLLLLRNLSIIVVPLLMAVIGILLALTLSPGAGALGAVTGGFAGLIVLLLELFGLGTACIIADDAWRHGRASFDRGWTEARRRAGEIFFASIGLTLLLFVASYAGILLPIPYLGLLLQAVVVFFCIWTIPAAAIGGVPGAAAIQISLDRVRDNPLSAALSAVVAVALVVFAAPYLSFKLAFWLLPYSGGSIIVGSLIQALLQAIAIGYVGLVLAKTYADASFGGRRW
jgi:hypothetical protein